MGRAEKRLYTVGRFWLAEREQSPFLQIRWYDERAKVTRSKSTGRKSLADAIPVILAHEEADRAEGRQDATEVTAVALMIQFWKERGKTRRNAATIASSFRVFMGFLDQDRVGAGATVSELTPDVWHRFMAWRKGAHRYSVEWGGKTYNHASKGVSGEATQRVLDDVRAALNHAVTRGRLTFAPKVAGVDAVERSPARDITLTIEQMGAIVAYSAYEIEALRWVLGMLATGCRPDAALSWNLAEQWKQRGPNLNTHPTGWPVTKKRNAIVPIIPEFQPWLAAWADRPHKVVKSRKTWWRTMRHHLELPGDVVPKTIRHTVATQLRSRGVPMDEIAGLLGHVGDRRITAGYAKYDPSRLPNAKRELSALWQEVCAAANEWFTNHFRVSPQRGRNLEVASKGLKAHVSCGFEVVGADGLEPPTLSV